MLQIDTNVLLGLIGILTGFLGLLTVLIRLLLKLTKQSYETQEKLSEAYESHSKDLIDVITKSNGVMTEMRLTIEQNTKASEKSVEAMDRFKDFVTQNLIQSTR